MQKIQRKWIVGTALALMMSLSCALAAQQFSRELTMLVAKDTNERQRGYYLISQQRLLEIDELKSIVKTSTDNSFYGSKHLSMQLLGDLRAREAVDLLSAYFIFYLQAFSKVTNFAKLSNTILQPCPWCKLENPQWTR